MQKREYVLRRAGYRFQVCNREDRLEVHHRTYDRLGLEDPILSYLVGSVGVPIGSIGSPQRDGSDN